MITIGKFQADVCGHYYVCTKEIIEVDESSSSVCVVEKNKFSASDPLLSLTNVGMFKKIMLFLTLVNMADFSQGFETRVCEMKRGLCSLIYLKGCIEDAKSRRDYSFYDFNLTEIFLDVVHKSNLSSFLPLPLFIDNYTDQHDSRFSFAQFALKDILPVLCLDPIDGSQRCVYSELSSRLGHSYTKSVIDKYTISRIKNIRCSDESEYRSVIDQYCKNISEYIVDVAPNVVTPVIELVFMSTTTSDGISNVTNGQYKTTRNFTVGFDSHNSGGLLSLVFSCAVILFLVAVVCVAFNSVKRVASRCSMNRRSYLGSVRYIIGGRRVNAEGESDDGGYVYLENLI
ncbi:putative membrane protein [Candidatus Ichthyocystis hellenicum]|uniref:Putative membrane protein n=1 Tax=Candidatus Ichthyocystis hellenicum TaxID=1561003 RepID=A0A0S4M402_9BURK|nr:hypothetical protein [Candidatus Ichthyocystis hellenicum]CUT18353.1 putative membrane protein [Candidatus Ichthyocystis hellenicum]